MALVLAASCACNPRPVATAPQVVDRSAELAAAARRDSLAAQAHRDSLAAAAAAAARADSLARVAAARAHADSVRAEVERNGGMDEAAIADGLTRVDDSVLVARVHFAFNEADLTPEYRSLLEQNATLFRRFAALRVEIAGHCDERGSDAYNLALGLRRAAAVKAYLTSLGVEPSRVSVVSYGKERPADPGHTEVAWAANRRAEFAVKSAAR